MARWFSRSGRSKGVADRQQAIIDGFRYRGADNTQPAVREQRVRVAVERIAVNVGRLCGVPEDRQDMWHAGRGIGGDAQGIWFQPNDPSYRDGRLHVGDRQWEVLGELTGRTGSGFGEPDFGSSIAEQRDTLVELVSEEVERARVNAPDAPEHRLPTEGRTFVDPGDARHAGFAARVDNAWLRENFGAVVNAIQAEGLVSEKTGRQLLAEVPDKLRPDQTDTAVKGFLDDLAAQSGTDPATFLNKVQVAPPAQKPWQIADSLMANSPLRDLPPERYLDAKERLTEVVVDQARTLNDAATHGVQEVQQRASGQVMGALKGLEAEAAAPAQAAQEKFIDPRVGVAEPGGVPAASGGDGSAQRPDHLQSQKPGQQLGS